MTFQLEVLLLHLHGVQAWFSRLQLLRCCYCNVLAILRKPNLALSLLSIPRIGGRVQPYCPGVQAPTA